MYERRLTRFHGAKFSVNTLVQTALRRSPRRLAWNSAVEKGLRWALFLDFIGRRFIAVRKDRMRV